MSVKQTLLDFNITLLGPFNEKSMLNLKEKIAEELQEKFGKEDSIFQPRPNTMLFFFDNTETQCTVRVFPDGFVALDVVQYIGDNNNNSYHIWTKDEMVELRDRLKTSLSCSKAMYILPITRGKEIRCYRETSDDRIIEYDFDRVVSSEYSPYQHIQIVHSPQFGNMLLLDEIEMIAESDLVYTQALLGDGRVDYNDKSVLILGGGDGGVLHELLKQNPKSVVMVEIDESVINASRKHLRTICGDSLDNLRGKNYEIIIDDCTQVMREFLKEKTMFDFVINDLTDVVIRSEEQDGSYLDFQQEIQDLSIRLLSPRGKYFVQGANGFNMQNSLSLYEEQLANLCCPVEFRKEFVFVPSFLELWTFYEIWKKEDYYELPNGIIQDK
ncbi:hypothetical protein ACROYT_G021587 [Oculina patagonica]